MIFLFRHNCFHELEYVLMRNPCWCENFWRFYKYALFWPCLGWELFYPLESLAVTLVYWVILWA